MCTLLPEHEPDFDMVLCSLSKLSLFIVLLSVDKLYGYFIFLDT